MEEIREMLSSDITNTVGTCTVVDMSETTTTKANFRNAANAADHVAEQAKFVRTGILALAGDANKAARANGVGLLPEVADLLDRAADLVQQAGRKAKTAEGIFIERDAWERSADRALTLTEEMNANLAAEPQALHCDMRIDCERPVAMIDAKGYVYCASHGVDRRQAVPCRKLRSYELAKLTRGEQIAKY